MKSIRNILSRTTGRLITAAVTITSLLTGISCNEERLAELDPTDPKAGYITLNLHNTSLRVRADEDTIDFDNQFNEDRIANARIYFFQNNAASDNDKPVFQYQETFPAGTNERAIVNIKLTRQIVDNVFPGDFTQAQVYVVANLPDGTEIPQDPTLGDLKAINVTSNFQSSIIRYNNEDAPLQASFVMNNGLSPVFLEKNEDNPSKSTVTGIVNLKRAAAKISLDVILDKETEDSYGNKWIPVPGSMMVLLSNGVKKSAVTPALYTINPSEDYFTTTNQYAHGFGTAIENSETTYSTSMKYPFYTYPNSWTDDNERMTYMNVMVPWKNENGVVRNCWYMVPLLKEETYITRNISYRVSVEIGVLGTYTPDEPLELDASIRAVEWGSAPIDGSIADYRYLVVDQESFVLNNEASTIIPFYSSHEAEVTNVTMTYYLFNTNAVGIEKAVTVTMDQESETESKNGGNGIYSYKLENTVDPVTGTRRLEFDHPLIQWTPYSSNDIPIQTGPNADGTYPTNIETNIDNYIAYYLPTNLAAYSVYEFEITIAQKNNSNYNEKIKITQYPGIYIQATRNFYSSTLSNNTPQRTNVYVNGNQQAYTTSNSNSYWCTVSNSTTRKNPNMYVVTITNLNDDTYSIGETRQHEVDNLTLDNSTEGYFVTNGTSPYTRWVESSALSGNSPRRLSYYYPTNSDRAYMYRVAPKIRISSFYSTDYSLVNEEQAKRRCAGYQEMGYAAGRWRLPTLGELQFIMNLWKENKIPPLFKETSSSGSEAIYWTAQGKIPVSLTNGKLNPDLLGTSDNKAGHIRCVYDEWYWGNDTVQSTSTNVTDGVNYGTYPFTWGDAEIDWSEGQ